MGLIMGVTEVLVFGDLAAYIWGRTPPSVRNKSKLQSDFYRARTVQSFNQNGAIRAEKIDEMQNSLIALVIILIGFIISGNTLTLYEVMWKILVTDRP